MPRQTAVVVWGLRGVMTCLKVMGGFPYSWDDSVTSKVSSPSCSRSSRVTLSSHGDFSDSMNQEEGSPCGGCWHKTIPRTSCQSRDFSSGNIYSPNRDSTDQEEGGVSGGFWAWSRSSESCQQLCPKLKRVCGHRPWVMGMSLLYLFTVAVYFYEILLKNGLPENKSAGKVIFFIMEVVTLVVLAFLFYHLLSKSDRLAALVSHLDTLPPGPSLHTWAPAYVAHTILLLVMFFSSLGCTLTLYPTYVTPTYSVASAILSTISFTAGYILTYVILLLYNLLLYLLCTLLAARMRDLRLALDDMKKRDQIENSLGEVLRQRVGPVLSDLWLAQTLLNAYLGPPILMLMAEMILGTISNSYYIFTEEIIGIQRLVYCMNDSFNLMFLCHAPSLMDDQLEELRYVMMKWRMETISSRAEKELTHLLDILDSYPSFSVAGYYMLSRARLVDIMSFSATYLVVLLQFRVGERPDEAPARPTPADLGLTSRPEPH